MTLVETKGRVVKEEGWDEQIERSGTEGDVNKEGVRTRGKEK